MSECATVLESESTRHWAKFAAGRGVAAVCPVSSRPRATLPATRIISAFTYTPAIAGRRAGMIESAFREECKTGLFGELAVLRAAVEVRLFDQPVEGAT